MTSKQSEGLTNAKSQTTPQPGSKDKEKDGKEEKEEVTLKLPKPKDDARAKWHLDY